MQQVPRPRLLAAVLAFLALIAVAFLPTVGVASAASPSTTCPPPSEEGPPPDPKCVQPVAPCPEGNLSCAQAFSGSGSAATLFANDGSGSFAAGFISFADLAAVGGGCGDSGPADPFGVLDFTYSGGDGGPKTIVLALRRDRVTKGIGLYNICWMSDQSFTQLGGTQAGATGPPICGPNFDSACYTGYLPSCKKNDIGPCVLFKKSGQYNVAFFGILAPSPDPLTYPN